MPRIDGSYELGFEPKPTKWTEKDEALLSDLLEKKRIAEHQKYQLLRSTLTWSIPHATMSQISMSGTTTEEVIWMI